VQFALEHLAVAFLPDLRPGGRDQPAWLFKPSARSHEWKVRARPLKHVFGILETYV
jgi:hypothetical protein